MPSRRHAPPVAARPAPRPRAIPFTFQCTGCATVEHRPVPILPDGWAIEEIGLDIYALCPDCTIDLPKGRTR